jgi:tripartite-type tricarboxylate transporter receptor subunit TctC
LDILYEAFRTASSDAKVKATLEKLRLSAPFISGREIRTNYQARAAQWKPLIEALKAEQTKK